MMLLTTDALVKGLSFSALLSRANIPTSPFAPLLHSPLPSLLPSRLQTLQPLHSLLNSPSHSSLRFASTCRNDDSCPCITWTHLQHYCATVHPTYPLYRRAAITEQYKQHKQHVSKHYASLSDYIRAHYFNLPTTENKSGLKEVCMESIDPVLLQQNPFLITRNAYPYALCPSEHIQHWLVWSLRPRQRSEAAQVIQEKWPTDEYDILFFENEPQFKSIAGVAHYQVFVRRKHKDGTDNQTEERNTQSKQT